MMPWLQFCGRSIVLGVRSAGAFIVWGLWLALTSLLVAQLYIVSNNELTLPGFMLRQIEAQLADSGLSPSFGRASVDPNGRVLIENLRVGLPAFAEPVLSARSVYLRLNPWPLLLGRVDVDEVQLSGVTVAVPAMLSTTGRAEEILRDFDATFEPRRHTIVLRQLACRLGVLTLSAHGTIVLPETGAARTPAGALGEFLRLRFAGACRQAIALEEKLQQLEAPALHLEFSPSESGAPAIAVTAQARRLRLTQPAEIDIEEPRLATRLLLFGDIPAAQVDFSATEIRIKPDIRVRGLKAQALGRLRLDGPDYDLREIALTADAVDAAGVPARALAMRVTPRPLPAVEVSAVASLFGARLAVRAETNLERRNGTVDFHGALSPQVLGLISARVGADVRKWFDFDSLTVERAQARFGDRLTFEHLNALVEIPVVRAYGVNLAEAKAVVELEPGRFYSPEVSARSGANFARGSYEQDLKTNQYRFLLEGRLRPLDISPWFRESWPNFFRHFEFPVAPPEATVDVMSTWRSGDQTRIFVFADAPQPVIRGTPLDQVRTRIFLRPGFYDGLEILGERDGGRAYGKFTYVLEPVSSEWQTIDFNAASTLDLKIITRLLGPLARALEPIQLAHPPELNVTGHFGSHLAAGGPTEQLRVAARTTGDFYFHHFPLQDVSLNAALNNGEIILDDIHATVASGSASGHARVWGAGEQRRLGFDLALQEAHLGQAAAALEEYFAAQQNRPPTPPGKFVQEKANLRLDLAASAEGAYDNTYSYHGDGSAVLRGAEISEVPLLGLLSDLLKFTSLRFTEARGNFKINGAKLDFPEMTLRGANSKMSAHGNYVLDRRELNFYAKVFPFEESGGLLKSVVGAVLAPLSSALEVKLTGSLEKPRWEFVMGPSNLLRSLGGGNEEKAAAPAPTPVPPPTLTPAPGEPATPSAPKL